MTAPRMRPGARRIAELADIDEAMLASATGSSTGGTGGMASRLEAARFASRAGIAVRRIAGVLGCRGHDAIGDNVVLSEV